MDDHKFLEFAIAAAREGAAEGGIPIGGALVVDGVVLGVGYNKRIQLGSPTRHGGNRLPRKYWQTSSERLRQGNYVYDPFTMSYVLRCNLALWHTPRCPR